MAGFYRHQAKLMVGESSTPDVGLDFQSEGLKRRRTMFDANGAKGSRSRFAARRRPSTMPISGQLILYPTALELATLLPWMLGADASGTTFALAETLQTFKYWALRGAKIFKYATTAVDRWTLEAGQGEPLLLTLDLCATTEDSATAAGSFPSFSFDKTTPVFMFHELVLTVNSVAHQCRRFALSGDNMIDKNRFFNSQSLVTLQPQDRLITLSHELPYGDSAAAYELSQSGVAATAVFTSGNVSLTMAMPKVQYEDDSPAATDPGEMMLPLTGTVTADAAALDELVATLDSSP